MYMKRSAMKKLESWHSDPDRKPLLLLGARQTGKTWLMQEFGKRFFKKIAYINFENNPQMKEVFDLDFDVSRLLLAIQISSGITIDASDTLILFDEIQEAPRVLTSLKYFCENSPEYCLIAAGSLLGISMHENISFPVGKVDYLHLYPLSFTEFLEATGNPMLVELLQSRNWSMIASFRDKYIEQLRLYYYIGGMPEVVKSYATRRDFEKVRAIQERLLKDYDNDFSKHAETESTFRIRQIWNSVPAQLAKENKKFKYSELAGGGRSRDFVNPMQWLADAGLITQVFRVNKAAVPLDSYKGNIFKIYLLDVGLLAAKAGLDVKVLLEGNQVFQEFKGALTEQYVLQQIQSECGIPLYYWSAERTIAEIDFLCQFKMQIVPVEVKAEINVQAKSLKWFCAKQKTALAIRTSMMDYYKQKITVRDTGQPEIVAHTYTLIDIPLYAISQILAECAEIPATEP